MFVAFSYSLKYIYIYARTYKDFYTFITFLKVKQIKFNFFIYRERKLLKRRKKKEKKKGAKFLKLS